MHCRARYLFDLNKIVTVVGVKPTSKGRHSENQIHTSKSVSKMRASNGPLSSSVIANRGSERPSSLLNDLNDPQDLVLQDCDVESARGMADQMSSIVRSSLSADMLEVELTRV